MSVYEFEVSKIVKIIQGTVDLCSGHLNQTVECALSDVVAMQFSQYPKPMIDELFPKWVKMTENLIEINKDHLKKDKRNGR